MQKEFLEAGKVVGTHGIKGELRVEPWCDSADYLATFKTLYWENGRTPVSVTSARVHKSLVLMKLEGVDSATQGDLLRGKVLYLARKDAKLPKGRYFIQDLIGMKVCDADTGRVYGELKEVFQTGANDVYRIAGPDGKEYLFPAVDEMIAETNLETDTILVRPIRGIFDDAD
jgi:16S rRNA processing protein RimM